MPASATHGEQTRQRGGGGGGGCGGWGRSRVVGKRRAATLLRRMCACVSALHVGACMCVWCARLRASVGLCVRLRALCVCVCVCVWLRLPLPVHLHACWVCG